MALFKQASTAAENFKLPDPVLVQGLGDDSVLLASQALETDAPVEIDGMTRPFLAHQGAAYLYALDSIKRWGGAFLGDDMGLGKTQVMEALIATLRQGGYIILVGPPVAKGTYEIELAAAFPGLTMAHLRGHKRYTDEDGNEVLPEADIYFISDDSRTMSTWLTDGKDEEKGWLIPSALAKGAAMYVRDEIHRDKGDMGKPNIRGRISLMMGRLMRAKNAPVVVATGTLLTNRPIEGYIPLQVVGGDALVMAVSPGAATKTHYKFRYCAPKTIYAHGREITVFGGSDLDKMAELHELLRRTVYCRREKADLGGLLPHSGWVVTPLALNGTMARYRRIEKDFFNLLLEEKGPEAAWKAHKAETITKIQALWTEAGVAKAPAAAEYVGDLVEQDKSVLVFFHHGAVRDALAKALGKNRNIKLVLIDGSVRGDDRDEAIAAIQDGSANVCLAQIQAAGVACTLTAASEAVFVQVPWSAGDLKQAADRNLRTDEITMERARRGESITRHVIQAAYENGDPTFDMAMWGILENKAKVCDAVNAGRDITMPEESIMEQALTAWYSGAAAIHGRKS